MVNETKVYQGTQDAVSLSEELLLIVCPNLKCRKEFKEPILLIIRSNTPPKQYQACPYCFVELEQITIKQREISEAIIEKEGAIEPTMITVTDIPAKTVGEMDEDLGSTKFLKKFRSLISNNEASKKENKKEYKDNSKVEKENGSKGCPETFGYLANRPKDVSFPQVCLTCLRMVDCMLSPKEE